MASLMVFYKYARVFLPCSVAVAVGIAFGFTAAVRGERPHELRLGHLVELGLGLGFGLGLGLGLGSGSGLRPLP